MDTGGKRGADGQIHPGPADRYALLLTFFFKSKLTGTEPAAGHKIYIVMSGSMEPALQVGSTCWCEALAAEEIRPGDIVTAISTSDVVSHRHHVEEEENGSVTPKDANEVLILPVPARLLVGSGADGTLPATCSPTPAAGRADALLGLAVLITAGELARVYLAAKGRAKGPGRVNSTRGPEARRVTDPNSVKHLAVAIKNLKFIMRRKIDYENHFNELAHRILVALLP